MPNTQATQATQDSVQFPPLPERDAIAVSIMREVTDTGKHTARHLADVVLAYMQRDRDARAALDAKAGQSVPVRDVTRMLNALISAEALPPDALELLRTVLQTAAPALVGLSEAQIVKAFWSVFRNFPGTASALTHTVWKDGIDIDKLSAPTMAFARAIEAAHNIPAPGASK